MLLVLSELRALAPSARVSMFGGDGVLVVTLELPWVSGWRLWSQHARFAAVLDAYAGCPWHLDVQLRLS